MENIGVMMERKGAWKVETGTRIRWFKTYQGACRFAARYADWKVEIPSNQGEYEYAKKILKIK